MLLRSPPLEVEVEVGAEPPVVADWAAAEAIKIAAVVKKVVICMLGECAVVLIFYIRWYCNVHSKGLVVCRVELGLVAVVSQDWSGARVQMRYRVIHYTLDQG